MTFGLKIVGWQYAYSKSVGQFGGLIPTNNEEDSCKSSSLC